MSEEPRALAHPRAAAYLPMVAVGAIAGLAALTRIGQSCLDRMHSDLFAVAGAVAPVIGLALFVEIVVVLTPAVAVYGATSALKGTTQILIRTNALMLVLSEGAALYAVGTGSHTGVLLVCTVGPWFVQLLLLVDTAYYRVGLNRIRA